MSNLHHPQQERDLVARPATNYTPTYTIDCDCCTGALPLDGVPLSSFHPPRSAGSREGESVMEWFHGGAVLCGACVCRWRCPIFITVSATCCKQRLIFRVGVITPIVLRPSPSAEQCHRCFVGDPSLLPAIIRAHADERFIK